MQWLRMIKDHIEDSFHIEESDFDNAPFDSKGGLAKMHNLFGNQMYSIIAEINEAVVA